MKSFAGALALAQDQPATPVDRLASVMTANIAGRNWHVTLRLDPPELGALRMDVAMRGDALSLRVHVGSDEVRRMVESRLADLNDALSQHDLHIARTEVVVQSPSSAAQDGLGERRFDPAGNPAGQAWTPRDGSHERTRPDDRDPGRAWNDRDVSATSAPRDARGASRAREGALLDLVA